MKGIEMESIRKQFSLDWLAGSRDQQPAANPELSASQSALEEALIFYSQPIFAHLSEAESKELRLHDLARALKDEIRDFKFEELWEVIKLLADRGFIQVTDIDEPSGNYLVHLLRT